MRPSTIRNGALAGTSVLALCMSAGFAAEPVILRDGQMIRSADGKVLVELDTGRVDFVEWPAPEPPAADESPKSVADKVAIDPSAAFFPAAATVKPRALSGTLALYGGGTFLDGDTISGDDTPDAYPLLGGTGAADIPFSEEWSLQLDVKGEGAFPETNAEVLSQTYSGQAILGAHINYREANDFLVGVFAGGGKGFIEDTTSDAAHNASVMTAGVEGQAYFEDLTAYGQVGWVNSETASSDKNFLEHAWFVRGVGRFFFSQGEGKVALEGSFAQGTQDNGSDNIDIVGWGVEGEHQIHNWGAHDGYTSVFLRYEGRHYDETTTSDSYFENTVMAGIRFGFNQMSLLSAERTGPAVDLPNVGRWAVGTAALD